MMNMNIMKMYVIVQLVKNMGDSLTIILMYFFRKITVLVFFNPVVVVPQNKSKINTLNT